MTIQEYKRYLNYIDIKEKENTLLPYITDELFLEIQTVSESEKSDEEWKKYYEEHLLSKYRDLTIDDRSPARLSILNSAFRKMELNECNKIEELNKELKSIKQRLRALKKSTHLNKKRFKDLVDSLQNEQHIPNQN